MQKLYDPYYFARITPVSVTELELLFFERSVYCTICFCFLTPFKDGIVHVTKVWVFLLQDKERQGKQSSPWKITVRTCQRQDGVNLITCFPLAGCTQRQTQIFRCIQPLSKPRREGCPDIRAAHVLLSLCGTVLINAAKASHASFFRNLQGICEAGTIIFPSLPLSCSILSDAEDTGSSLLSINL